MSDTDGGDGDASERRLETDGGDGAATGHGEVGAGDGDGAGEFVLYDLRVECVEIRGDPVASYEEGDYFEVRGEELVFPEGQPSFSMYALSSLLPLLPAKQRETHPNDWMTTDTRVHGPDPNAGGIFEITRTRKRTYAHDAVSGESLSE